MKKIITILTLSLTSLAFSQENETANFKKNELKINAALTVAGIPEITYERILNDESGAGISVSGNVNNSDDKTTFMLTPYYRMYFGKKPAAGLFVEGFGMINTISVKNDLYIANPSDPYPMQIKDEYTNFALGFGVGAKWITKKGIVFELNGGIGRNLTNAAKNDHYDHTFVGRGGVTVGYRF